MWLVHEGCEYEGGGTTLIASSKQIAIWYVKHKVKQYNKRHRGAKYWSSREDGTRYYRPIKYIRDKETKWYCFSDIIVISEEKVY